jgi:hypothetical protein
MIAYLGLRALVAEKLPDDARLKSNRYAFACTANRNAVSHAFTAAPANRAGDYGGWTLQIGHWATCVWLPRLVPLGHRSCGSFGGAWGNKPRLWPRVRGPQTHFRVLD